LGFFPRFLSVTATLDAVFVNPRAKQLEIAVLVAAALFQRHNVVAFMIHPYRTACSTCELVTLHDAAPCGHPGITTDALGCPSLGLKYGQTSGVQRWNPCCVESLQCHRKRKKPQGVNRAAEFGCD
jgi:hypothetical protein